MYIPFRIPKPVVYLTEHAHRLIVDAAEGCHPLETGGILIGVRARRNPWAVVAMEVRAGLAGPTSFLIPAGETRSKIDERRAEDPRLGYIGDWHIHPADLGASSKDLRTLQRVAASTDQQATTVVARRRPNGTYAFEAHVWRWRRAREAKVILTGALPALVDGGLS